MIKILEEPAQNGSRGPLPVQLDWLDHRLREASGNVSRDIPFQRPGWCSQRDWDAFRKGVRGNVTYKIEVKLRPTLYGLARYITHLNGIRASQELAERMAKPEPPDEYVNLLVGLSEMEQRQHAYYRAKGWMPWALTEQRGANIVVHTSNLEAFRKAWKAAKKANP